MENKYHPGSDNQPPYNREDNETVWRYDPVRDAEIRQILEDYRSDPSEGTPVPQETVSPASADPLFLPLGSVSEDPVLPDDPVTPPEKKKASARNTLIAILDPLIPHKGDGVLEVMRKCVFIVALMVLVGSLSYLAYDMVIVPLHSEQIYSQISQLYDPDNPVPLPEEAETFDFLPGMDDAFKRLYMDNTDLRGWIKFTSNMKDDFLKINFPIVQSVDNEYYLSHTFYNEKDKNGCLFFDYRHALNSPEDVNKIKIVYGHNMASGLMFAGLNKFVSTSRGLNYAKSAPLITMNTLFEKANYKVFAIVVANTDERDGPPFYYLRTGDNFSSDESFMAYIDEIRARSLFDYESVVDVQADDELLVLSTCTTKSGVHFDDGRLVVFARKVRAGESNEVDVKNITLNQDVIMPLAWYTNQKLDCHPYYVDGGYVIPSPTTSSDGTTDPTGTTDPSGTETTTPGENPGETTTTVETPGETTTTVETPGETTTTVETPGETTTTGEDPGETTTTVETPGETTTTGEDPGETTTTTEETPGETTTTTATEEQGPPDPDDT